MRSLLSGRWKKISVIKMKAKVLSLIAAVVLVQSTFAATIKTDHTWYLAGEPMKVSITANNATIAYAELCDTYGLAAGVVVSLQGGEGTGVIELPSDLHSGYYVLSVYTRDEAKVTHRLVAVVNALRKSVDDDIEWVAADSCWTIADRTVDLTREKDAGERETEGHIIKAHIKNVYDGQTFKSSQICPSLSIVGKQIHYFEGKMVNDSTAMFYTYGIHGKQPLVLSARSSSGVSLPIEIISPFAALLPKQLPRLVFHYKRSEVEARSITMQRHQKTMPSAVALDYDDTVFGIKPDLSYNLDEYRQFRSLREVLLEYVSCVKKKKINGITQLFVSKEQDDYMTFLPTLVLIDGMPVYDIERLLNYDARRVHYINIYGDQYTFGNSIYNGILSFVSRSGQLTNYPTEPGTQYFEYLFP